MLDIQLKNQTKSLYSFDVFDTLVTRTTIEPVGIFLLMQHVMASNPQKYSDIPEFVRNNFYTIRRETENFVRANHFELYKNWEITLEDIYNQIKINMDLTSEQIQNLIDLELEIEIKNIIPIQENINKLKELNKNNRVVLISDMYLSSRQIRNLLIHIDPVFENIPIYVSSEYKASKATSDLYKIIKKKEDVNYGDWTHFGDNKMCDINRATHLGIKTSYLPQEELLPYEKYALKHHSEDIFVQLPMGIAKATRTLSKNKSEKYKFGCSYAAPILYNYVSWVIEKALSQGIKTLHFVARDGYVLKEIADIIIEQKNLNLNTRYIYGSRAAWRIPRKENIDDYITWMCDECYGRYKLEVLAKKLGVHIDDLKKHTSIFKRRKKEFIQGVLNDTKLKEQILANSAVKIKLLEEYLKSELDIQSNKIVFVDINGTGRTQDILLKIIRNFYNGEVFGYYFHSDVNTKYEGTIKHSYIATTQYNNCAIELLCRNTEGQTLGYQESESGKVSPVLEYNISKPMLDWGFEDYIQGIRDFSINACKFGIFNNYNLISYNLYRLYFVYELFYLDKATADILGTIPFCVMESEQTMKESAPKLNLLFSNETSFNFISYARSNILVRIVSKKLIKYGSLRKFLFNIYISAKKQTAYIVVFGIKISLSRFLRGKNVK